MTADSRKLDLWGLPYKVENGKLSGRKIWQTITTESGNTETVEETINAILAVAIVVESREEEQAAHRETRAWISLNYPDDDDIEEDIDKDKIE